MGYNNTSTKLKTCAQAAGDKSERGIENAVTTWLGRRREREKAVRESAHRGLGVTILRGGGRGFVVAVG